MPELPEVETVVIGLNDLIVGAYIDDINIIFSKHLNQHKIQKIVGSRILSIKRRAKYIIIALDNNMYLLIHLKMTGQLIFKSDQHHFGAGHPSDSLIHNLPDSHTRIIISLKTKGGYQGKLFFNDQRKFGYIDLLDQTNLNIVMNKLGPEPLDKNFNLAVFNKLLTMYHRKNIKSFLLDQTIIAGVGNIYADESLHRAKIHPTALIANLNQAQTTILYSSIIDILKKAITAGGSSSRNYVNANGDKGKYLNTFGLVYGREKQKCLSCSQGTIHKIKHAGRGTHFCPHCQHSN